MRMCVALCGAVLLLAAAAAAQDHAAEASSGNPSGADNFPGPAASPPPTSFGIQPWQVAVSYEFLRFRPNGTATAFNLNGINTSVSRYFTDRLAIEGDVAAVFGRDTSPWGPLPVGNLAAKMVFYGAGPHYTIRNDTRTEIFFHALAGGAHFRFTASGGPGSSNALSYVAGGGIDYKFRTGVYWRVQVDFLGTRFFSATQNSFQAKSGVVLNF